MYLKESFVVNTLCSQCSQFNVRVHLKSSSN